MSVLESNGNNNSTEKKSPVEQQKFKLRLGEVRDCIRDDHNLYVLRNSLDDLKKLRAPGELKLYHKSGRKQERGSFNYGGETVYTDGYHDVEYTSAYLDTGVHKAPDGLVTIAGSFKIHNYNKDRAPEDVREYLIQEREKELQDQLRLARSILYRENPITDDVWQEIKDVLLEEWRQEELILAENTKNLWKERDELIEESKKIKEKMSSVTERLYFLRRHGYLKDVDIHEGIGRTNGSIEWLREILAKAQEYLATVEPLIVQAELELEEHERLQMQNRQEQKEEAEARIQAELDEFGISGEDLIMAKVIVSILGDRSINGVSPKQFFTDLAEEGFGFRRKQVIVEDALSKIMGARDLAPSSKDSLQEALRRVQSKGRARDFDSMLWGITQLFEPKGTQTSTQDRPKEQPSPVKNTNNENNTRSNKSEPPVHSPTVKEGAPPASNEDLARLLEKFGK